MTATTTHIYFDTEFHAAGTTVDLISIGLVSDDGAEYYATSNEFNHLAVLADPWLAANVLAHLDPPDTWKPRDQIADEIAAWVADRPGPPTFWAYTAAYDWVALCGLYGRLLDTPDGWPTYVRDLRVLRADLGDPALPPHTGTAHHALADAHHDLRIHRHLTRIAARTSRPT